MRVATIAIATIVQLSSIVAEQYDSVEFVDTPHRKRSQGNERKSQQQQKQRTLQEERTTDEEWSQWLGLNLSDTDSASTTKQVDDEGSMSMSPTSKCSFCTTGLSDPTFILPTEDGDSSCQDAQTFAASLSDDDAACSDVQIAELFCCPIVVAEKVEEAVNDALTDAGEEPISILDTLTNNGLPLLEPGPVILPSDETPPVACTLELFVCPDGSTVGREGPNCEFPECPSPPQVDGQCSCSPLEYNFILNLDSSCDTDELDGNDGIGLTFCFLGVTSNLSDSGNDGTVRLDDNRDEENVRRLRTQGQQQRGLSTITKEQKIIFEDTGTPLTQSEQQQMRFLAEDIEIISIQFLEFDTSGELIVINQDDSYSNVTLQNGSEVTFKSISNNLDSSLSMDDQLDFLPGGVQVTLRGRVTDDVTGDSRIVSNRITWKYTNACDVQPLDSDESIGWITTGELTPASPDFCPAVIPSTTTEAPPPETTEAPPDTTEAPPDTTEAPLPPPATTNGPMFSKSSKSKSGKAKTKKPHPMAKTEKQSDAMAKQVTAVDADSKSGKAKVDKDAKANKGCGTTPSGKSGKSGCGKSGKSGTTRLFHKANKMSLSMP